MAAAQNQQHKAWPRSPCRTLEHSCDDEYDLDEQEAPLGPSSAGQTSTTTTTTSATDRKPHTDKHAQQHTYMAKLSSLLGCDPSEGFDILDILKIMMLKEREQTKKSLPKDYLACRAVLVEWVMQTCETVLYLLAITEHTAIAYLDEAISKLNLADRPIDPSNLQLLATACILTAAKLEENDGRVPSVHDLNHCCGGGYTPQLIVQMEALLLNLLEWKMIVLTPRHFLDLYLSVGAADVHPYEETIENNPIPASKTAAVQRYQKKYAEFFVDLCLQDHNFVNYPPSMIASASIAAARRQLKLEPAWPAHVEALTQYEHQQISRVVEHIWGVYQINFCSQP